MNDTLLGIFEVASLAQVGTSAVANWRKRFSDFPSPVAELRSGPVFLESQIRAWLAQKPGIELPMLAGFYERLAAKCGHDAELVAKVHETVDRLARSGTSIRSPGVLLGKVQSGKTRAFLGIIALSFDRGYDVAVVLTKGTKSLARQTLARVRKDFQDFIVADEVQVHDIMALPNMTPYEFNQKLILVVKKEDDNLTRLLNAFENSYPGLQAKRVLIIDDEADFGSVSYRKKDGIPDVGTISKQIDQLRNLVADSDFLQVTATPYSLYLQPEDEVIVNGDPLFTPRRPKFTVVLPTHSQYVGGDYYFERSADIDSPAYYFYREVPLEEREALKVEDRRRLKVENVLFEKRSAVLCHAILTFIVGGAIRRLQARRSGLPMQKYSFLFHTEQTKISHAWQEVVVSSVRDALVAEGAQDTEKFDQLIRASYEDLQRSVHSGSGWMPSFAEVKADVHSALVQGQLMITKVNSENDIDALLDEDGQLRLRTPFNIFIGGQILDRGITISNLIAFYYGRNPKKFQQDTVLQHSRMYGARSLDDLAVTRFYAPQIVYQVMKNIHEFDAALREAFESGSNNRGVYFIQKDASNRVVPCSPNKLMFSGIYSIRPGRRLLPMGFQTVARTAGIKHLSLLDKKIANLVGINTEQPILLNVEEAIELLSLAYSNLEFDDPSEDDRKAHIAALEHLSRTSNDKDLRGKVWLITATDRNVSRFREEGRFSNSPDTKQQSDAARLQAQDVPVLMLLRQNGDQAKGWRDLAFWWPVIVTPKTAVTSIFASDTASVA
ncbi:Z1 domain-containing protein [Massilia sp. ZL223]|uniref:Z1 domain-containing protein n=1 Tax=Massilia sp. ZL223 TaxID=2824904 RepID=UPI001B8400F2|nr:Z1 domain-containing protein [Massilia sp. ZL223]MBQ5962928.1 hypothetical protein [Massilia sp. ZL223]